MKHSTAIIPATLLLTLGSICIVGCHAQAASGLQTYNATDQSASAGVPSGWTVTSGTQTVIKMTGPQGVTVQLGGTFIANNGAFQPGQRPGNGIDLSMPDSAPLAQKLGMIMQQGATISGTPFSQFTINSSTPLELPPSLGQCTRLVVSFTGQQGPTKLMGVFCSLPMDSGGTYKNILLSGQAPAAVAAQAAPTVQSIFQSYRIPQAWLQKKLAPFHASPPASIGAQNAQAAAIMNSTSRGAAGANVSANCFDLSVLRQTPTYNLPKSCGGTKPD